MDIKIELDRNDYVKNRLNLMKSLQIPTLSEAKCNLGSGLAQILFDQCDVALQADFGLTPLKGAGNELWISPSDLLIGKVALKPPLTAKHIQALTHNGILEIGAEIEKKFWNETKMHEENYFDARKRHIMDQFDELFRAEARNIELRERVSYQIQHQKMLEEFNEILLEELSILEKKLKEDQEESLWNQKEMLTQEWKQKFKNAIDATTKNLTVHFIDQLDQQKNVIVNNFKLELQKAHLQRGYAINMEKAKCKESIKQLRHNLECKNIANMMYVLCMERRKCCDEKIKIEEYYLNQMKKLNKTISNKDQQIKKLSNEKKQQLKEIKLREACLLEIIKQFQKFINFALRAAPTQAEFLLSVEKMMAFELANTVLKSNYSHLKTCNEILPWKYQEKPPVLEKIGLEIQDNHNCFEELTPEQFEENLGAEDYLPAFKYENKLYVREDFRNMISQEVNISRSNELWSKDVEILIETLRKSVSDIMKKRSEEVISRQSRSPVESVMTVPKSLATSSVQFTIHDGSEIIEKHLSEKHRRISINEHWSQDHRRMSEERRVSLKPVFNSLHNIDFEQIGTVEKKPALIAATNSLELIIKRGSIGTLKNQDESLVDESELVEEEEECKEVLPITKETETVATIPKKTSVDNYSGTTETKGGKSLSKKAVSPSIRDALVLDAKDSVIFKKASLLKKSAEFSITPNDSIELKIDSVDIKRKPSKLVTAKNSVELLRESKHRLTISSIVPCIRESTKPKYSSASCATTKCNDKCLQTKDVFEFDDIEDYRSTRKDSADRSIKLSHIEVIRMSTSSRDTNVAINITPTIYETGSDTYSTELNMYKEQPKTKKNKKKKATPKKDKFLKLKNTMKIIGDQDAKEHLQTTDEFTEHRIHSLIELIKDSPTLLRTFTACTR